MFRSTVTVAEPTHDDDVMAPTDHLIPISHLQLDLGEPGGGWDAYLTGRGVSVTLDDIGRPSISRADARQLFDERRENELRQREAAAAAERAAVEADRVRRASIWGGLPAAAIPDGVSAASAMFAADRDARPRRQSPLQHALSNEDGIVFHPIRGDEGES